MAEENLVNNPYTALGESNLPAKIGLCDGDSEYAISGRGLVGEYNRLAILDTFDVHLGQSLANLFGEKDELVILATALVAKALRQGSVCLQLSNLDQLLVSSRFADLDAAELPDVDVAQLADKLAKSPMVALGDQAPANQRPLRLVGELLYLEKYWQYERQVADILKERSTNDATPLAERVVDSVESALRKLFDDPSDAQSLQVEAVRSATRNNTLVITGGPGTGKTTLVANILAVLAESIKPDLSYALAAPTGKAAARLTEAVSGIFKGLAERNIPHPPIVNALTIHKLLEAKGKAEFGKDKSNPLGYDVVIVDESSMIALPIMAKLLEATPQDCLLIFLGDPDQLASVDAGAVLSDVVNLSRNDQQSTIPVVELTKIWRFDAEIASFAKAIRQGDYELAINMLENPGCEQLIWLERDPIELEADQLHDFDQLVLDNAKQLHLACWENRAEDALAMLNRHRILCARRTGPYGVGHWARKVEAAVKRQVWLASPAMNDPKLARLISGGRGITNWPGSPILITKNMPDKGLNNGDVGVICYQDGYLVAAIDNGTSIVKIPLALVDNYESLNAMTIHKSQGSQFDHVTIILPAKGSALLNRQLFYTGVTRAKKSIQVVGSKESLIDAINTLALRASGLGVR